MRCRDYTYREFDKILRDNGFIKDHKTGDHIIYYRRGIHITIKKNLNKMIARRLIKENNLVVK